jgi:dihydrofolate synthase/folylpolyglutamate synthase
VITRIGKDHTHLLGKTLAAIAGEKAGIIKRNVPVVVSKQHYHAKKVLQDIAIERNAPFHEANKKNKIVVLEENHRGSRFRITKGDLAGNYFLNLAGTHQMENLMTVFKVVEILADRFPGISSRSIGEALAHIEWDGRFQVIKKPGLPVILLDVAHNTDSIRQLVESISRLLEYRNATCILAVSREKHCRQMCNLLSPIFSHAILSASSTPRNLSPEELEEKLEGIFKKTSVAHTPEDALNIALNSLYPEDFLCVTGSFYIVGDILNLIDNL